MLLKLRMDLSDESLTGFASNMTGAGPWTMSTTSVPDGLAHQVSIRNDSANNHAGKTITLIGTDADGKPQTDTVTGPGGSATVESAKYFLTLTSATVSATIGADTFDFGWVDEAVSPTIPLGWKVNAASKWVLDVTGTINVDVQFAIQDIAPLLDQNAAFWLEPASSLLAETADSSAIVEVAAGYVAARVQVNSYSSGAELTLYGSQPELPA